jgi:hypothetical protein
MLRRNPVPAAPAPPTALVVAQPCCARNYLNHQGTKDTKRKGTGMREPGTVKREQVTDDSATAVPRLKIASHLLHTAYRLLLAFHAVLRQKRLNLYRDGQALLLVHPLGLARQTAGFSRIALVEAHRRPVAENRRIGR